MTFEEYLNKTSRYLEAEPIHLGNGVMLTPYRNGRTGKVPQISVFKPDPTVPGRWVPQGSVSALHGARTGKFRASLWGGDAYQITGTFNDREKAIEFLARQAQEYLK